MLFQVSPFLCALSRLISHFMQRFTQLIRTGSRTASTSDTFQLFNDIFYFHTCHQTGNTLQTTVTSTPVSHFFQHTLFYIEFDIRAASPLGSIHIFQSSPSSAGFMLV